MTNGRHITRRSAKKISLLTAVILLLVFAVGATVAYLVAKTPEVKNEFTPSKTPPVVVEDFKDYAKKSVKVQNTGDIDGYIRVVMIANELDADGNIIGEADTAALEAQLNLKTDPNADDLKAGCWFEHDGYFYWSQPVAAEGLTGDLIASKDDPIVVYAEKDGEIITNIQVTFLTEAIQAEGFEEAEPHRRPVTIAWGMDVDENGSLKPKSN